MLSCCLCGVVIEASRGHNAQPLGPGRCCEECDRNLVNPYRRSPPSETDEERAEALAGVEDFLDDTVLFLSEIVVFLEAAKEETLVPDWAKFRERFIGGYPEEAARLFSPGSPWMAKVNPDPRVFSTPWDRIIALFETPAAQSRAEGMLAAFRLTHGLVSRGEDEDLAIDHFPEYEP